MNLCSCTHPIIDRYDCARCGKSCAAALERKLIRVDPLDRLLKYRKALAYQASLN